MANRITILPEQNRQTFFIAEIFIANTKCLLISALVSIVFSKNEFI